MKRLLSLCLLGSSLYASENNTTTLFSATYNEVPWGMGVAYRTTNSPYGRPFARQGGESTSSFVQLLYYQGEHFYMDGTEMGYRAKITDNLSLATFARLRFADFPEDLQNRYQMDGYDPGLKLRYKLNGSSHADLEVMTDMRSNFYGNLSYYYTYTWGDFDITPYGTATYKSSGFNTRYYGLTDVTEHPTQKLGAGVDLTAGMDLWYHVASNFYLYGKAQITLLNSEATNSPYVSEDQQYQYWLGMAFRNDKHKTFLRDLKSKPYFRIAYGFATTSDLAEILGLNTVPDPQKNRLTSLFYGHPLSDTLFNLPVSVYLTPGIAWHHNSDVQHDITEFILAMKAYYTIQLPWRVRIGLASGISYVSSITYIEKVDMDPGEQSSKLFQHLGFSADISLKDMFGERMNGLWLGYDIHHRSAVFEQSSQYGRLKGGSNYNTVYLQYHF